MLVPVKWLKDYVNIEDINTRELADKLTMSGSHVDSIEEINKGVNKVVVGKIEKISTHTNADKLVITNINIGDDNLQIVTGAKNINEGDYVPVALVGSKLPSGMKIKKGELRGEVSNGMMCSAEELGINPDLISKELKNGIYILDQAYPLGKDIKEVLGLEGEVIDFEITPNRSDCLSIIGMARETAATFKRVLNIPEVKVTNETDEIKNLVNNVEILNTKLCRRYYTKVVKNIQIEKSPLWLRRRLIESNVKPINNIVDITNYVMLEFGQPIHAFDLDKIKNRSIIVRNAVEGEIMTTLDGVERKLDTDMLVIADEESPMAIAGVMGGEDSEVKESTKSIFIESANFDGRNIRLTSRKLGLRTDASAKYEKDIDPNISELACNRVCQLIEEIGAGEVVAGNIDIYENRSNKREITLRVERVNSLLGIEIPIEFMLDTLNRLELKAEIKDDNILVRVPNFRNDIKMETDLVEEIGRIYGFHNIDSAPLIGSLTKGGKSKSREIQDNIKYSLTAMGLNEITTYSFISSKSYDNINLPEESFKRRSVEIMNPLGEDFSVMRTTLIPNMLDVLSRNYKYGVEKAWAYEIGNSFIPKSLPVTTLPHEIKTLTIGMYGETNFSYLKGLLNELFSSLGIKGFEYIVEENHHTFHPGRCANILYGNHVLGTIGEIYPDVLGKYGIGERTYLAELDLDIIISITKLDRKYKELPKYPAITRDIAIIVDKNILAKQIEDIIRKNGGNLLEEINLFDVYQGKQIPKGKKSIAYSIVYRALDKTLTDKEVSKAHDKVVDKLIFELNAELRK